jgi:hypothetical protein
MDSTEYGARNEEQASSKVPVPSPALTDSPWFWLLLFSCGAVVALVVAGPKYMVRQARIENRFQNRETALAWEGQEIESPEAVAAARMPDASNRRELLIPLEPLLLGTATLVALGMIGVSWFQLKRRSQSCSQRDSNGLDH